MAEGNKKEMREENGERKEKKREGVSGVVCVEVCRLYGGGVIGDDGCRREETLFFFFFDFFFIILHNFSKFNPKELYINNLYKTKQLFLFLSE